MAEGTYLKDLVVLSVLLAGGAPGDSFRLLKIASLFFMSLALGAEAEKRVDQLGPHKPRKFGVREAAPWSEGHLLLHGVPPLQVPVAREVHASEHLPRVPHLETQDDGN